MTAADRALAQFVDDVDRAKDDLADEIYRLFPDQFIEVFLFDEDEEEEKVDAEGRRLVKASDIEDCPDSEIDLAFAEFDREIRRRLRELKEALHGKEAP